MGIGRVGLLMKGALASESFTMSRNWSPGKGSLSRVSKAPDVKTSE